MPVSQHILGMNARNYLYIRKYNFHKAKALADDKLATKRMLIKNGLPTTPLITSIRTRRGLSNFDWTALPPDGFVIKPARGYAGGGIVVFKNWEGNAGYTVTGDLMTKQQLETLILDIIDGAYSLQYLPDYAFFEKRVILHPFFRKLCPIGLPDIRVIVFNHIPVMTTLRLPTKESGGTANITRGAIAIGIDIRTGITTYAYKKHDKAPKYIPGTKTKIRGLKIPEWNTILTIATKTQAVSGLGYAGVDVVMDAKRGPLILENNARPGLSFQLANHASLRTRMERVEHLKNITVERGVELAKSLFAEAPTASVAVQPKTVGVIERIILEGDKLIRAVDAKIDTGAYRTSVDKNLVDELGFPELPDTIYVRSASGRQARHLVQLTYHIQGIKIRSHASVSARTHLTFPVIIGRSDLKGFVVDPTKNAPKESSFVPPK